MKWTPIACCYFSAVSFLQPVVVWQRDGVLGLLYIPLNKPVFDVQQKVTAFIEVFLFFAPQPEQLQENLSVSAV